MNKMCSDHRVSCTLLWETLAWDENANPSVVYVLMCVCVCVCVAHGKSNAIRQNSKN